MQALSPVDVVRLVFAARAAGDVERMKSLMDPGVSFLRGAPEDARVEVEAHGVQSDGPDHVLVHGRIRLITDGALTDSPADWRFTVRRGRVVEIAPVTAAPPRLKHVA